MWQKPIIFTCSNLSFEMEFVGLQTGLKPLFFLSQKWRKIEAVLECNRSSSWVPKVCNRAGKKFGAFVLKCNVLKLIWDQPLISFSSGKSNFLSKLKKLEEFSFWKRVKREFLIVLLSPLQPWNIGKMKGILMSFFSASRKVVCR